MDASSATSLRGEEQHQRSQWNELSAGSRRSTQFSMARRSERTSSGDRAALKAGRRHSRDQHHRAGRCATGSRSVEEGARSRGDREHDVPGEAAVWCDRTSRSGTRCGRSGAAAQWDGGRGDQLPAVAGAERGRGEAGEQRGLRLGSAGWGSLTPEEERLVAKDARNATGSCRTWAGRR
jgi:hypothetical protein